MEFTNAKGIWKSTGTKNIEEVLPRIARMCSDDGRESKLDMTFREFATDFFTRTDEQSIYNHNNRMKKDFEPTWYEANQGRLNNYLMPKFGPMKMKSITDVMIEDWYIELDSFSERKKQLSDNTKIKVLQTMKVIMKDAKRRRVIDINPCDTVERLRDHASKRGYFKVEEIHLMFPEDRQRLVQIWGSLQWALFFSIMVDTGWRCGEVSALRKMNFINGGVYSTCSVNYRTGKIKNSIKTTKKGQAYKVGILSDYTVRLYEDFIRTWFRDELFFLTDHGKLNRPDQSNYVLRRAMERLGIADDGRTEHCLRHSFDTFMLNNVGEEGVSHDDILELMAHTSYRPEYDHRTEADIIGRLSKAKPILNNIRNAQ